MPATDQRPGERPTLGKNDATIDRTMARRLVPKRTFGAHKWGVGGLILLAGAPGFAGAAILAAMAAGRAGAGIMNVAVPRSISATITIAVPEAATLVLSDGDPRRSLETIERKLEKSAALVVGPGLSEDETADALLSAFFGRSSARAGIGFGPAAGDEQPSDGGVLGRSGKPAVLDADALNWLSKQDDWPTLLPKGQAVLTPHVGEMSRLLGKPGEEIVADPLGTAKAAAKAWGQTVVLKYGYTAVATPERALVADDAPLSLATAGAGDILAGTIGAFLAQGLAPADAASLAVYVGMRAARRQELRFGTIGLVAGDLPVAIAEELAALERGEEEPA